MDEIPHWTVEETDDDGDPIGWRNQNNHTFIGILYEEDNGRWIVTGENSRIRTADSKEEAREEARDFMFDTPRPSGMV